MKSIHPFLIVLFALLFAGACRQQPKEITGPNTDTANAMSVTFKERKFTYQERELEYLMNIWEGEYDNVEQLDFDKQAKRTTLEEGKHLRIHNFTKRVSLPSFGEYVLYIEEYKEDNPEEIYRQSIYQLEPNENLNGIKANVYHFKNPKPLLSINKDLGNLKKMKPNAGALTKGCDLLLQREGMAFLGRTINKDCIEHPENEKLSIDYQIKISENAYWFQEKKVDKSTQQLLKDELQTSPYQLEKARCFVCMIDFPREEGGRPVETKHYIKIHDQGGKFEFDYKDGRHMVLGMRNTWSFGMQRETFVIFIQEESQKGPTLIYSWGAPGADRIGFNPGWIRVQCDLNNPRNERLQQELRPDS